MRPSLAWTDTFQTLSWNGRDDPCAAEIFIAGALEARRVKPRSGVEGRNAEPGTSGEGRSAELGEACEDRLDEDGLVVERRRVEVCDAEETCPTNTAVPVKAASMKKAPSLKVAPPKMRGLPTLVKLTLMSVASARSRLMPGQNGSLPVGSSANSTFGRRTIARAIATRCCCPADSRSADGSNDPADPARPPVRRPCRGGGAARQPRRQQNVLLGRQPRDQVVRLEVEPVAAQPGQLPIRQAAETVERIVADRTRILPLLAASRS
jgi:hypothetical protein